MITQTVTVKERDSENIIIGRRGTYQTEQIVFDVSYLVEAFGDGSAVLMVKRPPDDAAYPATVERSGSNLIWTVSESDTYAKGHGEAELFWYVDGGLAKSVIYSISILRDIAETTTEPPEDFPNWIEQLTELGAETLENAQAAAQSATDAEESATDAAQSAAAAAESAADAEHAAQLLENVSATATTLNPGEQATAEYNDGEFVFGIPRGNPGPQGPQGEIGPQGPQGEPGEVTEAELTAALNTKAPIIIDTATGSVVSIPDGAGGIPFKQITASFSPIQNLNGQEAPYPPGGGKNKFDPTKFTNRTAIGITSEVQADGSIKLTGTPTNTQRYSNSTRNILLPAGTYCISVDNGLAVTVRGVNDQAISTNGVFTVDGNTLVYFNIGSFTVGTAINMNVHIQIESGSTATAWSPYENECPISGHTGCEVVRDGKNLFDVDTATVYNRYINTSDNWVFSSDSRSYAFPCKPNTTYTVSCDNARIGLFRVGYITERISPYSIAVSGVDRKTASGSITITTGVDATYIIVQISATVIDAKTANLQIELSTTASDYEAFSGTTVAISFGQTVYGCKLTVFEDGSGQLVVDRAMRDLGELTWLSVALSGQDGNRFYASGLALVIKKPESTSETPNLVCSMYKAKQVSQYNQAVDGITAYTNGSVQIYDSTKKDLSAEDFNTAMSGVQLCYELASPVTIPLTAEQISTLPGVNNVWINFATGDITVDYPADTKLWILKKLAELAA